MRKITALLLTGATLFVVPWGPLRAYNVQNAQSYLEAHAGNPWSTMGLAVLGAADIPTDHLKSVAATAAIDYAAPILAVAALNQNPRTFGTSDYVAGLKSYAQAGQIGDTLSLNDDIFGLLALIAAGESRSDPIAVDALNYILIHQNSDGGWSFVISGASDTNTTAAAVTALLAAGVDASDGRLQNALDYLRTAQNEDGGFPYDPNSSFGRDSDSSSTAWVIWALNALGLDPASWSQPNGTPVSYLESTQVPSGYFEYQPGAGENSFSAVNTAYAVIALQGRTLPTNIFRENSNSTAKFAFRIQGSSGVICQGQVEDPTALDIVKNASSLCNYTYVIQDTSFGPYLVQINNDAASGNIGWLYLVNCVAPSVGAADYTLSSGDFVYWYYGEWDKPPTCPPVESSGQTAVNLTVTITKPEPPKTIALTVTPSQVDFGLLAPGATADRNVQLENIGDVDINVKSTVTGDPLFVANLLVSNTFWAHFQTFLPKATTQAHTLTLPVPGNYPGPAGQKSGEIIFWATP